MISKLGEEIYEKSIQLKKYNSRNLLLKKNRLSLIEEFYVLQEKVEAIIDILYDDTDCNMEYFELALLMRRTLAENILFLDLKNKNYRNKVEKFVLGFCNLPRAFLSAEDPMSITVDEAKAYYGTYLEVD